MSHPATLRGAVVGCGYVSQFHLDAWKHVPRAEIVAVVDPDPLRLERAAGRMPGVRRFESAEALFEDGHLDFIEICTRPESHRELVELAARHGTHVLCQKPSAFVRPELRAMIDACDTGGVRLMIHENWRFRPWYRALRAEIDAGTVGRPIRLRIAHRDTRALRADGFADQPYFATMKRLILIEMGCHLVDTARYLIGDIQTVAATIGRFGKGHIGEDLATLQVGFAGGPIGLLDMSWCAAPPESSRPAWALNETVVEGTAGTLGLMPDGSLQLVSNQGKVERRPVPLPPDDQVYIQGYAAAQAHFINGLLDGTDHETRGSDNLKTMDVVWTAYRAAEEGTTLVV